MSQGTEAKKHAASSSKLRKQREKGTVANSADSSGFLATGFGITLIVMTAPIIWSRIQEMITRSFGLFHLPFPEARQTIGDILAQLFIGIVIPILAITLLTAFIVSIIYNNGLVFALKPVSPQMSRISPGTGVKRIYGRRGLIQTPVSLSWIAVWLIFATILGLVPFVALLQQTTCAGICMVNQLLPLLKGLVLGAIAIFVIAAIADMIMQRKLFLHEQKMTETERKQERKDQHGTPEIRQERRRRMREGANAPRRTVSAGDATMCFFYGDSAVGIQFQPPDVTAPYIVAQATTLEGARALRARIADKGWPVHENAILTRAGLLRPIGETLDESVYPTFVGAVRKMFNL